jgi:NAD(P)-dependent dehydrogenase (short-subunit alcohol dehydrogenase family)
MNSQVSIITGAGSGIGRALALAQAARGVTVVAADLDEAAARGTAEACGGGAWPSRLDVRSAADVDALVREVAMRHGRIDYLFNNAGIGVGGEAFEIDRAHWDRIIDVNLRGVVNGILAAYPVMVRQGRGHIVNTASLAGLGPAPLLAPYAMTKHAVVGLSSSLRIEAKRYGVRVSVLCPAAIETPLLDSMNPADLKAVPWAPDIRRFLTNLAGPPYPADAFAEEALAAIARNRAVIVIPRRARLAWRLGRLFPGLAEKASEKFVTIERRHRRP